MLTARRRLIGGFYAYDNQMKTTKLGGSCSTTTDELGLAKCTIDPGVSGEVYIVATTRDADGNVSRAVRSVWLAGDEDWWFGGDNGDRMDVVPEQQTYKAGETARFQVRMPFREADALVTVEREGVLSSFVTKLSGADPVVEVKMPGSYAPDVFVSVMAVRGRAQPAAFELAPGDRQGTGLHQRADRGAGTDRVGRPRQAELSPRHRQGEGRLGSASARRDGQGQQGTLCRARHRDGRRLGQGARRQAREDRRSGLRRGRPGVAATRAERQLERARRDDGRPAACRC